MRQLGLSASLLVALAAAPAPADVTPANVATLAQKWNVTTPSVTGGPVFRDGRLYVGTGDGMVRALDPTTGAEIWKIAVDGVITGRVGTLDDGGVCYGTLNGVVGCLNGADGTTRWTTDIREPLPGSIWSAPVASGNRLFVGVASYSDNPCTRGRLVALDLADGHELWRFYTVPDKVCQTDTAVECTVDGDCPKGGPCVKGVGGGVTATPAVEPTGMYVYMNTVGCYTNPSIGESDSMFKIEAATGNVVWRNRVDPPEQFGTCIDPVDGNTGVDCGVDADCPAGNTCMKKALYHDFGFLNGPLRIDVPDGVGGMKTLIVSGSKNGTLYAFDEPTGMIAWKNVVRDTPISPRLAGFGLFNGAIAYADGRIFAALYQLGGARSCSNDAHRNCQSDANCQNGGTCVPEPKHLMAFDATTGESVWEDEIGRSWSHVTVANGVVYAGTQVADETTDASNYYAYDAGTGQRLATFPLAHSSTARAAVVGDTVYVGYGLSAGGVLALSLCGNGTLDSGETCDTASTDQCCSPTCAFSTGETCDDGDACTTNEQCSAGTCAGAITSVDQLGCSLDQIGAAPCGDEALPKGLANAVGRGITRVEKLLAKAAELAAAGKTSKVEKLRQRAMRALDALSGKAAKAAASRKESKRISGECRDALTALVTSRRALVEGFGF
jgi:outer membrane protein assembly factor BamB